jgi:hypothetical protein
MNTKSDLSMPSCGSWLRAMQARIALGPSRNSQFFEDKKQNIGYSIEPEKVSSVLFRQNT